MPATVGDDNILVTYEMDTIGAVGSSTFAGVVFTDSSVSGKPAADVAPPRQSTAPLTGWGTSYPQQQIVAFAKTLMGTPYMYGSTDPAVGFDCSGFITYVFNHFNLKVPRSSVEFTNRGREVAVAQAQPGDLILFTGTDSTVRIVGHMGIVIDNSNGLQFIHSSSGKANGVTVSPLQGYYQSRFVKVISLKDGI